MKTIAEINQIPANEFCQYFANVYEHSEWLAEAASEKRPFSSLEDFADKFKNILAKSSEEKQMQLIRAHPDLAGKLAIENKLTSESKAEQASVRLDALSEGDFKQFQDLNNRYRDKFNFPFIICVLNQKSAEEILQKFHKRLQNSLEEERQTALAEINQIARHRINNLVKP